MIDFRLPELSASTTEATLVAWHKQVGDTVAQGDLLAEVETDKSTIELEAESAGVLAEILVAEGSEGVEVGTVLARLRAPDEAAGSDAAVADEEGESEIGVVDVSDAAPIPEAPPLQQAAVGGGGVSMVGDSGAQRGEATAPSRATPLARRMATQANVDLARVEGSGHKGRIVRFDVERSLGVRGRPQPSAPPPPETAPERHSARPVAPAFGHEVPGRDEVLNGARKRAAERLAEAKRTAPHFYLDLECDAERLIELRSELNEGRGDEERPKLTLNDLVVRIAALAFRRVPEANVSWQDGVLRVHERVDLAVAVASEHGLVTPVVRDAGRKGVGEIAVALRDLAGRAQQGKLRPEEYTGGTATLSNLGMYGVRRLYPILNLPQACILGVGSVEPSVVARDGEPVVRRTVVVTLAADHRALDGATGARLLAAFRALVENPLEMLL